MDYESPTIDVVGQASAMIQAYFGLASDGDGYVYSWGATCSPEEE